MKKKLIAFVLAGAMTFGASLTAFAADATVSDTTAETTVTGTGSINVPTIRVTVPTAFDVVLNPFQIAYEDADGNTQKTQIVTVPQLITNESNVAVAVNVKEFKATPSSDVKLSAKPVAKATDKSVYLYLEIVNSTTDTAANAKFTGTASLVPTDDSGDGSSKDAIVTLAAGDETATYAAFKLGGDMVVNPVEADGTATPWVAADKVDVSFKFTFTPQMATGK